MNTKIFTICYNPEQFEIVGPPSEPWDNTENLNPQLREFPIFEKAFNSEITQDLDYWGLLSPKFEKKSYISVRQFYDWILKEQSSNKQLSDVYFINPVPIVEAIFPGTVQHGEACHPGMIDILQRNLNWYTDIDLSTLYMDCNTFSMCNYFVANRKFWNKYIEFVNLFLKSASSNKNDYDLLYNSSANYGPNKSLPYYTFVVERLFSIFLNINNDKFIYSHYFYNHQELLTKTSLSDQIVNELIALSDIKQVAISGRYSKMMQHWAFYRNKLTQQNQYLFLME